MAQQAALTLRSISFKFSAEQKPFFENLNVTFDAGTLNFVCGRNGVGKSVFFNLLRGSFAPNNVVTGHFELAGRVCQLQPGHVLPAWYTTRIRLVQQKFDLMLADKFTFEQNLALAQLPQYPGLQALPKKVSVPSVVHKFGIDVYKTVNQLSGGQRQILAMLMMLQKPCNLLLLDEPTAALDEENTQMVMDFVRDVVSSTGVTVVIISHDKDMVQSYAPNGYFLVSATPSLTPRIITFERHA